jgi:hypothetical protein
MSILRLRTDRSKPSTIRVKIAVALDDDGNWVACGGSAWGDDATISEVLDDFRDEVSGDAQQQFWLVVDLPLPTSEVHAAVAQEQEE